MWHEFFGPVTAKVLESQSSLATHKKLEPLKYLYVFCNHKIDNSMTILVIIRAQEIGFISYRNLRQGFQ